MKFPLSTIDIIKHQQFILNLLLDDDTIIFIDTNIIALLYKLNNKSRDELFNWLRPFIDSERLKVPNWVTCEYTNRFIRNKTFDYLSPLSSLKTITKEYNNVIDFLNLHIDEDTLSTDSRRNYSSISHLKSDIGQVKEIFEKISFMTKSKNIDYVNSIHSKIEIILNKCHIESDLDNILSEISHSCNFRYLHKLPPGFQDSSKDLNEYGDLIIWKEILKYCKIEGTKKVLFLTNDVKKDWVYAPLKILDNGRLINNSYPEYKIIDNRLVHEFFMSSKSEEIEIVSFENLAKILICEYPGNFTELGRSLQLINHEEDIEISENDEEGINTDDSEIQDEIGEDKEVTENSLDFKLSETALKDKYINLSEEDDLLTATIIGLKSYNWYKQNPALETFIENIKNYKFNEDENEQSKLFVIGRNIYQAACGSSASAYDLISEGLRYFVQKNTDYLINLIVAGMTYEIYFNSENEFRVERLKSRLINEVLSLEQNPRLEKTKKFIVGSLEEYSKQLIYMPYSEKIINMTVEIDHEIYEIEDWFSGKTRFNKVNSIQYKNYELLTEGNENVIEIYQSEFTVTGILNIICVTYAIPEARLKLNFKNLKDDLKIVLGSAKFKKNWI